MTERERILGALPDSIGADRPEGQRAVSGAAPGRSENDGSADLERLWSQFASVLEPLGGRIAEVRDLEQLVGRPVLIEPDALPLVAGLGWTVTDDPWEAEAGITSAQLAVAETGSLLLTAGDGKGRMSSLAPPIHVCLAARSKIVATLQAALERLEPRNSVLISGPSRTADIEGVLVRGVHGPKELWVITY